MLLDPRTPPRSGRSSLALLLALAGVGGLLSFVFSRSTTSRASPLPGAPDSGATPEPAPPVAEAPATPTLVVVPALVDDGASSATVNGDGSPAAAVPAVAALDAAASSGDANLAASAAPTGPKLTHVRAKGSSRRQDVRPALREKELAKRKERQAARAQDALNGTEPASANPATKRVRPRDRVQGQPPKNRKPRDG